MFERAKQAHKSDSTYEYARKHKLTILHWLVLALSLVAVTWGSYQWFAESQAVQAQLQSAFPEPATGYDTFLRTVETFTPLLLPFITYYLRNKYESNDK
jgi:uncharacterized membrane protein YukC